MADLKTIIQITQEELKRQTPAEEAVAQALDTLKTREASIIRKRYGLGTAKESTLQEIGAELGVTRERVRQIEQQGLLRFREQLSKGTLADIVRLASEMIRQHGGVIACDTFFSRFLPESQQTPASRQTVRFLLEQLPEVRSVAAERKAASFYATSEAHALAVTQTLPLMVEALEQAKKPMNTAALLTSFTTNAASEGIRYLVTEPFLESALEIGKDFVEAPDDAWGLAVWPDINPRNIREKTLFVLKKTGTPLHFKEIADKIRESKFDEKRVTPQAVHNELINGDDFVLIGRGLYALRDWGYIPGTVADVIRSILNKSDEPVERDQIVDEVLKQRHVSRNTILINLQEKTSFRRVGEHAYTVEPDGKPTAERPEG